MAAEEQKRTPVAKATSLLKKLWDFFKPVAGPMGLPIPSFIKSFFGKPFGQSNPKVAQA